MSKRVFEHTITQLEGTRERLLIDSMLLADCAKDLPVGRRSNRTKRYLAVNLRTITNDYERTIKELTEQLEALRIVQAGVTQ